mmetsp:Transcript_10293/g.15049  ORF Transcript_10293/g.15049 Transcript_10293/m.15049 type:complete len:687 (+) Transcript_10293:844-2904(+)
MVTSKGRKLIEPFESKLVQESFDARSIHRVIKTRTQRNVSFILKIVSVFVFLFALLRINYVNGKLIRLFGSSMRYAFVYYVIFLLYAAYILFAIYATYKIHTTLGDDLEEYKNKKKVEKKDLSKAKELTKKLENLTYHKEKKEPIKKQERPKPSQLDMLGLTGEEYDLYEHTQLHQRHHEEQQKEAQENQQRAKRNEKFEEEAKQLQRASPSPQPMRTPTPTGSINPFADMQPKKDPTLQEQGPPLFLHTQHELDNYLEDCEKQQQKKPELMKTSSKNGYLNNQGYFVSGKNPQQQQQYTTRESAYKKVEKQSTHLQSFLKGTDAAYQKYMQATIGDMDSQMLSYASTVISDDIPQMNAMDDSTSIEESAKSTSIKYDYNSRYSGSIQPDTSPRPTVQKKKLDIQSRYAAVLKSLNITSFQMSMWSDRLRRWFGEKLIKPIVAQVDALNSEMRRRQLSPFDCTHELDQPPSKYLPLPPNLNPNVVGEITLRKIIYASFPMQDPLFANRLTLEKYLYMPHTDRRYVLKRLKSLITGGYLTSYKWNSGGDFEGKQFEDYSSIFLPTDSELILTIFCNYMDLVLPSDRIYGRRAFTRLHFQDCSTKANRHRLALRRKEDQRLYQLALKKNQVDVPNPAKSNIGIRLESRQPPYFSIEYQYKSLSVEPGRSNLFKTIILFVYLIKKKTRC